MSIFQLWLYLLREAVVGLQRTKISSLTSILTVAISSSILGVFVLLTAMGYRALQERSEQSFLQVYVAPEYESGERLDSLEAGIRSLPELDSVYFISKTQALEEFKQEFDSEMAGMVAYNPLPPSFGVRPAPDHRGLEKWRSLRDKLSAMEGVEAVGGKSAFQLWMDQWKKPVFIVSLAFVLCLGGAVALIIGNSVKLNLLARRSLVESMKYCGASPFFITVPFLLEGVLIGLLGSLLGVGLSMGLTSWTSVWIPRMPEFQTGWFVALMLGFTCLLSGGSSFFTVRKFIRHE